MRISDWSSDVCSSDLPASLVQLTEQVEYGRQFQQALEQYCGKQAEEAALQARLDIRERWKAFITKAATLFADTEATLSKAKIADIDSEYKDMFREIIDRKSTRLNSSN